MTASISVLISNNFEQEENYGRCFAVRFFVLVDFMDYKTVKNFGTDEYIVKKSRFIGYVKPVSTVDEAMAFVNEIKTKHRDARHNVFAYMLKDGNKRYSDDGEPQGTAGIPVLDVIEKERLFNIVVVVTRYFGGILLGGGGLVRAYSHTAKLAIDAASIVTKTLCTTGEIACDYGFYGRIPMVVNEFGGIILDTVFEDNVKIKIKLPKSGEKLISDKIIDLSGGKYNFSKISEEFSEI